jgi:hypothetical protein
MATPESMILLTFQVQSDIYNIHIVSFRVVTYAVLIGVYLCFSASIFTVSPTYVSEEDNDSTTYPENGSSMFL